MQSQINYDALSALTNEQEWWFGASDCHGILTGLICFDQFALWPDILFKGERIESKYTTVIERLGKQIEEDLQSQGLRYQVLLPQEVALADRAQALVYWAEGMLIAKSQVMAHQTIKLDKDCEEFLQDLQELIQLDTQLPDSEQNAQLLTNLEEHCRMGALLIYASVHTDKPA